jgi:predicted DNA binding CopG/RHH family protein
MARSIRRIRKSSIPKNNHPQSKSDQAVFEKKNGMTKTLNAEERDVLASYERGEWRSVPALREETERYQSAATVALESRGLVGIRLSEDDLQVIRRQAAQAGISHQVFIANLVHEFVSGKRAEEAKPI